MSEIVEIIDTLEGRLKKLVEKIDFLEKTATQLTVDLQKSTQTIQTQSEEMERLKKQYDTLKIANSLLGSEENKRDTKLKINSLIREIDYCIAPLAE
jgi:chromosome segregation ATPase